MAQKPKILDRHIVTQSRLFTIEALALEFSNGVQRQYERLVPGGSGAVMMVPINEHHDVLLIREYAAGLEDYTLTLPKGAVDLGETLEQAAQRELQEEIKLGAHTIHFLKHMTLSPSYIKSGIDVFIALNLYQAALEGDEPEPLDVIKWPLHDIDTLVQRGDVTEGRAIAALYMAKSWMATR